MTYQPFLPEAAAGSIEPRHVVVPLRRVLKGCRVVTGGVTGDRPRRARSRRSMPEEGPEYELAYDQLVVALGSVARTLPIPGLAEDGHRLQERRRGHRACATTCWSRSTSPSSSRDPEMLRTPRSPSSSSAAGTPASRRSPSSRTWPATPTRYYHNVEPEDMQLGPGRGHRPHPARGRRGARPLHRRPAAPPQHRRPAGDPARVLRRRARRPQRRRSRSTPTRSSGPPA